ncbi:MAG: beta galactosidase jelly roll domain-containing protein [Firmicutes bacterium]|nr:beta galactosidase jelly roll domain-containing protein [Bacillota bacterium]
MDEMKRGDARETDEFAQIAQAGMNLSNRGLVEQKPPKKENIMLPFNGEADFSSRHKISTNEELYNELEKARAEYEPFMRDLAPEMESYRTRRYLSEFDWRLETGEDEKSFDRVMSGKGNWDKVSIPHYSGPIGRATAFYRTVFTVTDELEHDAVFLRFNAVDYRAQVFVNGRLCGTHEGFFAPFEFEIKGLLHNGNNTLLVVVENDEVCGMGGDKIYAASGLGYDDPEVGWHCCPPGMGICQEVYLETRSTLHIRDLFVRPILEEGKAEACIEVYSTSADLRDISLNLSVYGQNFQQIVFENLIYHPQTNMTVGMGDSLTEADVIKAGMLGKQIPLKIFKGINSFKIPFEMLDMRIWALSEPWLYQLQVRVIDENGAVIDTQKQQFGMRSFRIDENSTPKGAFYLNGRQIRLRGANTMGHEQQCVFKKDWNQLSDDILLAKLCNMNFLRLTQRPVQKEVYEYCDRLGLMTQTDLPLFGVLRRNQFTEAVKQAVEMERLIRPHACNIVVSYINEPFPNAFNSPHLHLLRPELNAFFECASIALLLQNPDRVIKPVDGDYDPPGPSIPDNHCYPAWYNSHGIELGKLNKGYWIPTKPGWYHGCGEFGAEGLDPVEVMRRYYPASWLPHTAEDEKTWSPNSIIRAQSGSFHYFFYETPDSLEGWVAESHRHQAWATKFMTEAFRRDANMGTFAVHLFIDAFPSGWMKTIMDVERRAKPAYFTYRNALEPLMISLRSDNYKMFAGKTQNIEVWICNDFTEVPENATLEYKLTTGDKLAGSGCVKADIPVCSSKFQGSIPVHIPDTGQREKVIVDAALVGSDRKVLCDSLLELEVFPLREEISPKAVVLGTSVVAKELVCTVKPLAQCCPDDIIMVEGYQSFAEVKDTVLSIVNEGARLIIFDLPADEYDFAGSKVTVKDCGMLPVNFVARNTGHKLVKGFEPDDFRLWYDPGVDYITPILSRTFTADDDSFIPILTSGNTNNNGEWGKALAVAEKKVGKGSLIICQLQLANRTYDNPVAFEFAKRLFDV